MNVAELKEQKDCLESEIKKLIENFYIRTGVHPYDIRIDIDKHIGNRYIVSVDINLDI